MQSCEETAAASVQPVVSLQGFQFHTRCQKIDWRKIASVDVDKIAREVDVDTLQKNLAHLTFCDIDTELDGALVDRNFVKLFKLAQLCIEYLMHSQELLLQSLGSTEEELDQMTRLLNEERKFSVCDQEAIKQLQRENRKRKRIIQNQQLEMLRSGRIATAGALCPYCRKVFLSLAYLQAHVVRRHPDQTAPTEEALLEQWEHATRGAATPTHSTPSAFTVNSSELLKGLQEIQHLLRSGCPLPDVSSESAESKRTQGTPGSGELLLSKVDQLERKCELLLPRGTLNGTGGGEVRTWPEERPSVNKKDISSSESRACLEKISQQLQEQKQEVGRMLAQQQALLMNQLHTFSRDLVLFSKTNMYPDLKMTEKNTSVQGKVARAVGLHRRSKALLLDKVAPERKAFAGAGATGFCGHARPSRPFSESLTASPLRLPLSTLSVPVPAPRLQRNCFQDKAMHHPSSYLIAHQESSVHAKSVQSSPLKEKQEVKTLPHKFQDGGGQKTKEYIKSAVHSTPNLIDALKEEIMDLTRNKLSSMGLDVGKTSVADSIFRDCSRKLNSDRKLLAKRNNTFFDIRNHTGRPANCLAAQRLMEGSTDVTWLYQVPSQESLGTAPPSASIPSDGQKASSVSKATSSSSEDDPSGLDEASTGGSQKLAGNSSHARHFLVRSRNHKHQASCKNLSSHAKPHAYSMEKEGLGEMTTAADNRDAGSRRDAAPKVAGEIRSRPQSRFTSLVQTIESQLLNRSTRPPMGSVNTVMEVIQTEAPPILYAGDQKVSLPAVPKNADQGATPSSGATKIETSRSQLFSEDDLSIDDGC